MNLNTESGQHVSLVITKLRNIAVNAPFRREEGKPFHIKNNSTESVTLKVVLSADDTMIETPFAPGWNIEMVKEIVSAVPADASLQWGV